MRETAGDTESLHSVDDPVARQHAKILLVDDRPDNLLALSAILSSLGHTLVRAHSGEEALKAMLVDEFAVVILDVQMPGMDGYATAAHIKRRERTRTVPIIFLTASYDDPQDAFRGYAAGAVDYITKPFDPWVLRAKVTVFVDLYLKSCQLREQAALLRASLGGTADPAAALQLIDELSARVTGVEEELAALGEEVERGDVAALVDVRQRLGERVARLRGALDALRAD